MINYSILYKGSSTDKKTFFYQLNGKKQKDLIIRIFNTFTGSIDYEEKITLTPGVEYWTALPSFCKNRYVKFIDMETFESVGIFSLEGTLDLNDFPVLDPFVYLKEELDSGGKYNLSSVLNEILGDKVYDNDFVRVSPGDIVIDIGFNMGIFSLDSLKYFPSRIISFEPNHNLVRLYRKYFQHPEIDLYEFGVSNKKGKSIFYENPVSGLSTTVKEMGENSTNEYEVEMVDFMTFMKDLEIDKIGFLKIDCEGGEIDIINSIPDSFMRRIDKMAIEFHYPLEKIQEIIDRIKNLGFEILTKDSGSGQIIFYARK